MLYRKLLQVIVLFILTILLYPAKVSLAQTGYQDISARTHYNQCVEVCRGYTESKCRAYWTPDSPSDYYGYGICRVIQVGESNTNNWDPNRRRRPDAGTGGRGLLGQ